MSYHLYVDARREWRWRLKATNGRTIADSGEGYINKQDCINAIYLVKGSTNAPILGA